MDSVSVHIAQHHDRGAASLFVMPYSSEDPAGELLEMDLLITNTEIQDAIFVLEVAIKALKEVGEAQ